MYYYADLTEENLSNLVVLSTTYMNRHLVTK